MEGVIWCGSVVYGKENKGIEDFGNDEEILGVDNLVKPGQKFLHNML